jgi:predicted unusual protein kinase regulating ubiquinone biosynthesis (AarF/ABC1/UbiB family)
MDDGSSLGQRIKRITNVTTTLGGTALKGLKAKLTGNDNIPQLLTDALGKLKGPAMKVGQVLAMVPGMLPEDMAESLMDLQSNAPAMGWPFVRRRMAIELGAEWQAKFACFEREASAAASLGQVHKARLHSGEWVACKLQYPGMLNIIEGDLDQLSLLLSIYEMTASTLDTSLIQQELKARLKEELDYRLELERMQYFRQIFATSNLNVKVPKSFKECSTDRLLTMEWCDGVDLMTVKTWPLELREQIAEHIFQAWYYPLYKYGVLHGDPHFGNYRITSDGEIIVLDFGCVREFSASFLQGVMHLYDALKYDNTAQAKEAYEIWGFTNLTAELVEALNIWAKFLYNPLLEDRVRPLMGSPDSGKQAAKAVLTALKQSGKVQPPKEFVFMDRAAVGIGSAMIHLGVELNWHRLFHQLLPKESI